ncbi:unnamed protein product [Rotaria socialis]|uniref:Uncharacterized protein n=1 Tax=Rotaria socialis TaxID=392032 RepID=A0A818B794_9BILA|nr:unnamed protein product [Rotaria socialis]CAF3413973.1 unnamed protein product [Rotaria socialis]CAF3431752.1 unnamed protein product [Rotaria socialis]CAF4329920.1 unnamed protein product [Rotaria socialis]CAF4442104.1 unnamed protein product [Rotaria socialis]
MITFQSTSLSGSSINCAIFTGPKKGLQITTALAGLPQNTGVLAVENAIFLGGTSIESNGNYPFSSYFPLDRSPSAPTLQLTSAIINDSTVSNGNTFSESILIITSKLYNTTIRPIATLGGIQFVNSKLINITIKLENNYQNTPALLQFNDSIIENTVEQYSNWWDPINVYMRVFRSIIRNSLFARAFVDQYYYYGRGAHSFILQDSTIENVSIDIVGSDSYYYYYGTYTNYYGSIFMNNSTFNNGTIRIFGYGSSATFQDSRFCDVNIAYVNPSQYYSKGVNIKNVIFRNVSMNLPVSHVLISYSTIELKSPPLVLGDHSAIVCSLIKRSLSIAQENTTGIQTTGTNIILSTISSFAVGLQVAYNTIQKNFILNSNFISNSLFHIRNFSPYNIEATGNWWGTRYSADIRNKIYDYWNSINLGGVICSNPSDEKLQAEDSCPPYNVYTIITNFANVA